MRKCLTALAGLCLAVAAWAGEVTRVEPLSWWTGMKTDLQLLVNGEGIGAYSVAIEGGKGVKIKAVHQADSPNYLFVDVDVTAKAKPGTYTLVFKKGNEEIRRPYVIAAREKGSADRKSFTTADLIYLIVPDRFANGDPSNDSTPDTAEKARRESPMGRHGGDLQGVIDHLDYIADLGATALWSTPLLGDNAPRGSYHGYACSDYYHIDPRYGSNELYREMVGKAHEKGIKIIMDVVTNHSSTEHWWMKDLPFKDWVHMNDPYVNSNHQMGLALDPNASKADRAVMEEGWFVPSMPDMNLDNPYMLKYFQQWAVWWIEYSGLDGFRVDTWFYNEKVPMSQWAKAVTDEFPDFNIVGENWQANPDYVAYWQKDNPNTDGFNSYLPSIMDFPLQGAISNALTAPIPGREQPQGMPGRGRRGADISGIYNALSHDFVYHDLSHMMIFLSNHDIARIGDTFGHDPRRMKIAFTLLATLRGIPQMFYGDELMFVTGDPRRDDGRLRMDFPGGWPGDPVDLFTEEGRAKAAADSTWAHAADLHDYVRTLFQWRKGSSAVQNGRTLHFIPEKNTYGYFRYDGRETVFVFINNSDEEVTVPWTRFREMSESLGEGVNVLTGERVTVSDATRVAPQSALVVDYRP
ncbi:MAG: glycoside hydrolase family 13 protein [Bacteroidales bacterium]|nr:glycoside hydrolase family 13 protein [Bacteroidales bacterium]